MFIAKLYCPKLVPWMEELIIEDRLLTTNIPPYSHKNPTFVVNG